MIKYLVVDNEFNRIHYPELIGLTYNQFPPSYAVIKVIRDDDTHDVVHDNSRGEDAR